MKIIFCIFFLVSFETFIIKHVRGDRVILQHPSNATVPYMTNHSLNCVFNGIVNCSWLHDGIPVMIALRYQYGHPDNTPKKNCSIRIESFQKIDDGKWQCHGKFKYLDNSDSGKIKYSEFTSLPAHLKLYKSPSITLSGKLHCPEKMDILSNAEGLTCTAAYGAMMPKLHWELDGNLLNSGPASSSCDRTSYCNSSITWLSTNVTCQATANSSLLKCWAYYEDTGERVEASIKLNENVETRGSGKDEMAIVIYSLLAIAVTVLCIVIVILLIFCITNLCRCHHSQLDIVALQDARPSHKIQDIHRCVPKSSIHQLRNSLYKQDISREHLHKITPDILKNDYSGNMMNTAHKHTSLAEEENSSQMQQMPVCECNYYSPVPSPRSQEFTIMNSTSQSKKKLQLGNSQNSNLNNADCLYPPRSFEAHPSETLCCGSCCTLDNSNPNITPIKTKCSMTTHSSLNSLYTDGCSKQDDYLAVNSNYTETSSDSAAAHLHHGGNSAYIPWGYTNCSKCIALHFKNCPLDARKKSASIALHSYNGNYNNPFDCIPEYQLNAHKEWQNSISNYTDVNEIEMEQCANSLYDDCGSTEKIELRRNRH